MASLLRTALRLLPLTLAVAATACGVEDAQQGATTGDEDDLTSLSARSRSLRFDGYVYVSPNASDSDILSAVRTQTQTAFGALRTAEIGVNSRELKDVDPTSFKKKAVTVVDTSVAGDKGTPMLKVSYRYKDSAVVPVAMAKRSAITLAVMGTSYRNQLDRVLKECTANDSEAQEFQSSIWYVFDPSHGSCQSAIAKEQKAIDDAAAKLADPKTQVSKLERDRLYIPITVALGADKTNKGTAYPEYDKLYTGGVQKDRLVVSLVNGMLDHGEGGAGAVDSGYEEWLTTLREVFKGGLAWKIAATDPATDLLSFTLASGKTVKANGFGDFVSWQLSGTGFPAGVTGADRADLLKQAYARLTRRWIKLEAPVQVSIGGAAAKPFTIELDAYFGAEGDSTPHKRGIKNSDVFIYNGHSYIGYGPLDPSRFSASDFPASYQLLFIDGCVSYNYYEKDYFPLKNGGTANLELITNGLEAPSWQSGYALGRFLATLLNGKQASYKDLLDAASDTDSLRVVDGEVDNKYSPSKTPIVVTK
jgi:hypothetical protein